MRFSNLFRTGGRDGEYETPPPYSGVSDAKAENNILEKNFLENNEDESSSNDVSWPLTASNDVAATLFQPEMFTLYIGPAQKSYVLPKAKICEESKWIRDLLHPTAGKYVGQNSLIVNDGNPQVFDLVVAWLGTQRLPERLNETQLAPSGTAVDNIAIFYRTALVWEMLSLQNDIVDATRKLFRVKNWGCLFSYIWSMHEMGLAQSELFHFFLDILVYDLCTYPKFWQRDDQAKVKDLEEMFNNPALTTIGMKHVLKFQLDPWGDPRADTPGCHYHNHADGCKHFKNS